MSKRAKTSKTRVAKARLDDELRRRLDAIHERHLTSDSRVVEELIKAFCDAVEERGSVQWPAVVLLAEKQVLRAAEDPPDKVKRHRGAGPDAEVRKPA